jgi:hypothetical protein
MKPHVLVVLVLCLPLWHSPAQDKKNSDKKPTPTIKVIVPLGAAAGATTQLTIRGLNLDNAKEVKLPAAAGTVKIVNKGKAPLPDKNPDQVGDTQVVVELKLETKLPVEPVTLTVVTLDGESKPHHVLVETALPVVKEKEPNDGFRQAMEVKLPVVVEGMIERPRDVDVFRIEGKVGQKITAELLAARYGSPVDGILTLYDAAGQQLGNASGTAKNPDPVLVITLPQAGTYYLSLIDAHDGGGPVHSYRLMLR